MSWLSHAGDRGFGSLVYLLVGAGTLVGYGIDSLRCGKSMVEGEVYLLGT